MKCTYCNAELEYGYKYCIKCGNLVEKSVTDTAYNETFWGKTDALIQKYENNKLKKFTGNYLFRIVVLIVSLSLIYTYQSFATKFVLPAIAGMMLQKKL